MSDICGVDCGCTDGECQLADAFVFGVTYGMMVAGDDSDSEWPRGAD